MTRWIPVFLCLLLSAAGASAQTTMEWMVLSVHWGGATSHGNIRVSGLPPIQSLKQAGKSPRSGPTGQRRYKPIRIRKRVDAASPFIRRAHETKRPLPQVVIKGRDRSRDLQTIELQHVMINSISEGEAAGGVETEEITITVENIRMR